MRRSAWRDDECRGGERRRKKKIGGHARACPVSVATHARDAVNRDG